MILTGTFHSSVEWPQSGRKRTAKEPAVFNKLLITSELVEAAGVEPEVSIEKTQVADFNVLPFP